MGRSLSITRPAPTSTRSIATSPGTIPKRLGTWLLPSRRPIEILALFPNKSRRTVRSRMRAVVMKHYPYIVFFRLKRRELEIVHVLHAAQRHPAFQEPAFDFAR
jgi:hypothetical protein